MKNLRVYLIALFCTFISLSEILAAEWQWSVQIPGVISNETNDHPQAFLWIPSNCTQVKGVVIGTHNMSEETLFENPLFREKLSEIGIGLIWITPGWEHKWDVATGCQEAFDKMLVDFAAISGYSELKYAPIIPLGHSAMATFPWNFAAWNPERTLAIVSLHGDAPRTNLTGYGRDNMEWGKRTIDGIPGLMIEGEYEWWEDRVNPALAFRMMYPKSCISFLCDAGRGHFDIADRTANYIALFIKKAVEYRLPDTSDLDKPIELKKLNPQDGWLAQRWHPNQKKRAKAAPCRQYKGDVHDAFWYFDKEIAQMTEERYRQERGKKPQYLGFVQDGQLLSYNPQSHVKVSARFMPEADGLTFHLKPVYTDSLHTTIINEHSSTIPEITRICGPVQKVNDTTFTVRFYRMGMYNQRRTGDICLLASNDGDSRYKSTVQELSFRIPYRNKEGMPQQITFPKLQNINASVKDIELKASSDSELPVYYYVKEGPAEVKGNQLVFTKIPPRAKYPVKVTVVAWQYGRNVVPKVQTAESVEQCFYITK